MSPCSPASLSSLIPTPSSVTSHRRSTGVPSAMQQRSNPALAGVSPHHWLSSGSDMHTTAAGSLSNNGHQWLGSQPFLISQEPSVADLAVSVSNLRQQQRDLSREVREELGQQRRALQQLVQLMQQKSSCELPSSTVKTMADIARQQHSVKEAVGQLRQEFGDVQADTRTLSKRSTHQSQRLDRMVEQLEHLNQQVQASQQMLREQLPKLQSTPLRPARPQQLPRKRTCQLTLTLTKYKKSGLVCQSARNGETSRLEPSVPLSVSADGKAAGISANSLGQIVGGTKSCATESSRAPSIASTLGVASATPLPGERKKIPMVKKRPAQGSISSLCPAKRSKGGPTEWKSGSLSGTHRVQVQVCLVPVPILVFRGSNGVSYFMNAPYQPHHV